MRHDTTWPGSKDWTTTAALIASVDLNETHICHAAQTQGGWHCSRKTSTNYIHG